MKRDYYQARRARIPLIQMLEPLGLSLDWIAEVVGCDKTTLREDLKSEGITRKSKMDRAQIFRNVIKRYAECWVRFMRDEPSQDSSEGFDAEIVMLHLGDWLQVNDLVPFINGLVMAMGKLIMPGYHADLEPEAVLIRAMLCEIWAPDSYKSRNPVQLLSDYFVGIQAGAILPPSSHDDLLRDLTDRCVSDERGDIKPVWPHNVREVVGKILDTLTEREAKVIRMRFGIGGEKSRTLEEVGNDFEVTRERIRFIEAKALRKLRHPSRSKGLKSLLEPFTILVHAPAPINTAPVAPPAPIEFDRLNHLVKSVDELEMSVRSMNCLQNGNIRWVWELAERTEPEMLRIKSFGWKSLRELNELLAEMGLAFGTKYSEEFKQLLIERTHGRGNPPASVAP